MKCLLFSLFVFNSFFLVSQNLKTYNGKYKDGDAVYTYYEENDNRIYHGNFKYTENGGFLNVIIQGSFKNGLKDGTWSYVKTQHSGTFLGVKYNGFIETSILNFTNGKRNGTCTLKKVENKTGKILKEISCAFLNNKISGEYRATMNDNEKYIMNFSVNSENELNGEYIYQYTENGIPHIIKNNYSNGILITHIHKNNSNGEIIDKKDFTAISGKFTPLNLFLVAPDSTYEYYYKNYFDNTNVPQKIEQYIMVLGKPYYLLDNSNASEPSMHTLFLDNVFFEINIGMEKFYRPKEYIIIQEYTKEDNDDYTNENGINSNGSNYQYLLSKEKYNKKTKFQNQKLNEIFKSADSLFNNQKYLEAFQLYRKYSNQLANYNNEAIDENLGYEKKVDSIIEILSKNKLIKAESFYNSNDIKNAKLELDTINKYVAFHSSSVFKNNIHTKTGLLHREIQDLEKIETSNSEYQTSVENYFETLQNSFANQTDMLNQIEILKSSYRKLLTHYHNKKKDEKYKTSIVFLGQVQKNILDRGNEMLLKKSFINDLKNEIDPEATAMKIYLFR